MNTTADSNLTKRALAAAMKELMEQMPFSKISVSDIAEQCGMNRKSFYYHFKEVLEPSIKYFLASSLEEAKYQQFCINFYADAFIAAFVRWLSDKDCVPPQEFVRMLKVSIYAAVKRVEVAEL